MLKPPGKTDPIKFLVERKFPLYKALQIPPSLSTISSRGGLSVERRKELTDQIDAYKKELKTKPPAELQALFEAEQAKYFEEQRLKSEQREKELFFHQPNATANFDHWSKASYWTLEEALALSFGKEPKVVTWEKVRAYTQVSPFAKQYELRRDLVQRAMVSKQLHDATLPGTFLAWAKRNDFDVPEQLIERVEARGIQVADWKTLFEQLKEKHEDLFEAYQAVSNKLAEYEQSGNSPSTLEQCNSWSDFKQKAEYAIEEFPKWKKTQWKIRKTGNLQEWLTDTIDASPREAEIIKKFLTELFEELK
jgi:hypothetical protein